MATKFLDGAGVQTLWGKIKTLVEAKVADIKADVQTAATNLNTILGDPTDDPTNTPTEGGE